MSTPTALGAVLAAARGRAEARRFDLEVALAPDAPRAWEAGRPDAMRPATAFQEPAVLEAWYRAAADEGVEPVVATVRDARTGLPALGLPLALYRTGRSRLAARVVGFADLGLVDYNAPLLGPAAPRDEAEAARVRRILRRALRRIPPGTLQSGPRGADVLELLRMPPRLEGHPNPLAPPGAAPAAAEAQVVRLGPDFAAFHHGLKRTFRKELERAGRVFERHPAAAFRLVEEPPERARVLGAIEAHQPARMRLTGRDYRLDAPLAVAFYRRLAALGADKVALAALFAGDEVVAGLLCLVREETCVMLRIGSAGGAWANASPGRLVIHRTIEAMHARGCRTVDFGMGDYDYKRRFGAVGEPLVDDVAALTPRGLPALLEARARGWVRARPGLRGHLRRAMPRALAASPPVPPVPPASPASPRREGPR